MRGGGPEVVIPLPDAFVDEGFVGEFFMTESGSFASLLLSQ